MVELLVAIVIIVTLAGVIFAASRSAIQTAKTSRDVQDARQIGQLVMSFTTENAATFPYAHLHTHPDGKVTDHWVWTVKHGNGISIRDPAPWQSAMIPLTFDIENIGVEWAGRFSHYKVYQHLFPWSRGEPPNRQVKISNVNRPAEVILFGSASPAYFAPVPGRWNGCGQRASSSDLNNAFYSDERKANMPIRDAPLNDRYKGKSLVCYVDGHVQLIRNSDFKYKNFTVQY